MQIIIDTLFIFCFPFFCFNFLASTFFPLFCNFIDVLLLNICTLYMCVVVVSSLLMLHYSYVCVCGSVFFFCNIWCGDNMHADFKTFFTFIFQFEIMLHDVVVCACVFERKKLEQ
jgi:hypothetical protein